MTYPAYVKEKARRLRVERKLSIDEIAERLALPRITVYEWVRDLPLARQRNGTRGQRKGTAAMQLKYRRLREAAYEQGHAEFDTLAVQPGFKDFVCLYVGEGYKRSRNVVSLANSDPHVILLADHWIRRFARNPVGYTLQYHADQQLAELVRFWSRLLRVDADAIRAQRKSNSNQLAGRTWRSRHGVLSVYANDTQLRARLQAWIDRTSEQWLDWAV